MNDKIIAKPYAQPLLPTERLLTPNSQQKAAQINTCKAYRPKSCRWTDWVNKNKIFEGLVGFKVLLSIGLFGLPQAARALTVPQGVDVIVNSHTYQVSFFEGSYNSYSLRFNTSYMPWWGNGALARQLTTAVGDSIGYVNTDFYGRDATPFFAFAIYTLPYIASASYQTGLPNYCNGGPDCTFSTQDSESWVYATAVDIPPLV